MMIHRGPSSPRPHRRAAALVTVGTTKAPDAVTVLGWRMWRTCMQIDDCHICPLFSLTNLSKKDTYHSDGEEGAANAPDREWDIEIWFHAFQPSTGGYAHMPFPKT